MSSKKLETKLYGSWSTYAVSMMSVLKGCGMWGIEDKYAKFLGMSGIAFQFIMHKDCSPAAVTVYKWVEDHKEFMNRIGVTTKIICAMPNDTNYEEKIRISIKELKEALDSGTAITLWGVDTGEFGIILGYDDDDGVFLVKGIGSNDSNGSNPILYSNLGRTFQPAPILYCEYPLCSKKKDEKDMIIASLQYYVKHMESGNESNTFTHGLAAYDHWINSLSHEFNQFGMRYVTGVYNERKTEAREYLKWAKKYFVENSNFIKLTTLFEDISELYAMLHFKILEQGNDGWNYLKKTVSKEMSLKAIEVIKSIKVKEIEAVRAAKDFLNTYDRG